MYGMHPQPRNDEGSIHALILEQPAGSPTACRQGCWPNKEAKFASIKARKSPRWVARTSGGERIIRSNACMHRCISLHVIISLGAKLAGAGVGSGAHIPLAHHKPPRAIAPWAAGWLGGLASGRSNHHRRDPCPEANSNLHLRRSRSSLHLLKCCALTWFLRAPPAPTRQVPRKKGQGEKKEKKKEIGAAPFTKSRGMMKMTCIVFLSGRRWRSGGCVQEAHPTFHTQ